MASSHTAVSGVDLIVKTESQNADFDDISVKTESHSAVDDLVVRSESQNAVGVEDFVVKSESQHAVSIDDIAMRTESQSEVTVDDILKRTEKRSREEMMRIVKSDPPRPILTIQQNVKKCRRNFQSSCYSRHPWLAGCPIRNRLFCFPCLLFSSDRSTVWTATGYNDLSNFSKASNKHETAQGHIRSVILQRSYGRNPTEEQMRDDREIMRKTEEAKRNRDIMKRFIDVTCHLIKQEQIIGGPAENVNCVNRSNYVELSSLLSDYDLLFRQHLSEASEFNDLSNNLQSDLISSVSRIVEENIIEEITKCDMLSIEMDETTDSSSNHRISIIFRFVKDSVCVERFYGFIIVGDERSASDVAGKVLDILESLNAINKLVAQTYDGASILSPAENGVHAVIKERCQSAFFVHCYVYNLNSVISQSLSIYEETIHFFQTITGLSSYFKKSPKRASCLENLANKRLSNLLTLQTFWHSKSTIISVLYENLPLFHKFFQNLIDKPGGWDHDSLNRAQGYKKDLHNFTFLYLLNFFKQLFTYTDILIQQASDSSPERTMSSIRGLIDKVPSIYHETCLKAGPPKPSGNKDLSLEGFQLLSEKILDTVLSQLNNRFLNEMRNFQFVELLNANKYQEYRTCFPEIRLQFLKNLYDSLFDFHCLKTELTILYSTPQFSGKSAQALCEFLYRTKLTDVLPQLYKLTKLCLTIPISKSGESTSCLKRIKHYLRSLTSNEYQSDICLVTIEKALLCDLKLKPGFYDRVIDIFVKKEKRINLMLR